MNHRAVSAWRLLPAFVLVLDMGLCRPARAYDLDGLLTVHGFADVYYTGTSQQQSPSGQSGFKLGNLDLYLAPNLSGRIRALMEDVVEFDDWTVPGEYNGQPAIDIERLQVGYLVNDELTVWMGRFHTPYGYWNTAYHHGAQLQPTVMRPQFIAFEDHGGILPAHTNGLWATGRMLVGPGHFTYDVYVGNGSRNLDGALDMQNAGNSDSHTATGTRLGYEFKGGPLDTLWIGLHAFSEEIDTYTSGVRTALNDVRVVGGFVHWTPGDWEIIGEYYGFDNKPHDTDDSRRSSNAWFLEADYTVFGLWTPMVRYERALFDQQDPYFSGLLGGRSYIRSLIGVRYDITPETAIKLDGNHTDARHDGGQQYNEVHLQVAIRF